MLYTNYYNLILQQIVMQKCQISGKGKQYGRNVSFSLRRTPKVFKPNLQKKTLFVDGQKVRLKISTHALRTLKKKNLLSEAPEKYKVAAKGKS